MLNIIIHWSKLNSYAATPELQNKHRTEHCEQTLGWLP